MKMKKVLIWAASIIVVILVGGAFAANYAVDKVLKSMSGMDLTNIEATSQEDGAGNEDDFSEPALSINDSGTVISDPETSVSNNGITDEVATSSSSSGNSSTGQSSSDSQGGGVSGQAGGNGDTAKVDNESSVSPSGYSAEISVEKATVIEENITVKEKAKVISTLMGSLSASDLSTLQQLASGGLSVEEKKEARSILLEKLTEDEYNELITIAAKYGVSQGRKYAEVKDE